MSSFFGFLSGNCSAKKNDKKNPTSSDSLTEAEQKPQFDAAAFVELFVAVMEDRDPKYEPITAGMLVEMKEYTFFNHKPHYMHFGDVYVIEIDDEIAAEDDQDHGTRLHMIMAKSNLGHRTNALIAYIDPFHSPAHIATLKVDSRLFCQRESNPPRVVHSLLRDFISDAGFVKSQPSLGSLVRPRSGVRIVEERRSSNSYSTSSMFSSSSSADTPPLRDMLLPIKIIGIDGNDVILVGAFGENAHAVRTIHRALLCPIEDELPSSSIGAI